MDEVGPVDRVDRTRSEERPTVGDLAVPRQPVPASVVCGPVHVVVGGDDADDPLGVVAEIEYERDVPRDEVAEPGRIEPARRVREADLGHSAWRIRPPRVDGAVGEPEVGGQVTEQVEAERRRPQEVGPQPLVIEALVTFDDRRSGLRRVERARGDEVRAGLLGVGEREAAADGSCRRTVGSRCDRM